MKLFSRLLFLWVVSFSTPIYAALTLDGSGCTNSGSSSPASCAISTSDNNDIIVAEVFTNPSAGTASVTAVSGGGLTWTKRTASTWSVSSLNYDMEIWYARASSPLSSQTISATVTGTALLGVSWCLA